MNTPEIPVVPPEVRSRRTAILKQVAEGLKLQGRQSKVPFYDFNPDGLGVCRYRGPEGRKCAVGQLIPDGAYSPEIEGAALSCIQAYVADPDRFKRRLPVEKREKRIAGVEALIRALKASDVQRDDWGFLETLQRSHDNTSDSDSLRDILSGSSDWWLHMRERLVRDANVWGADPSVIPQ